MATKAMSLKMDEADISATKQNTSVSKMTMADVVKEAVREYVRRMREDPFYRLASNAEDASPEENEEILDEIENLTDDDLSIQCLQGHAVTYIRK